MVEGDDGVHRKADVPTEAAVTEVVNTALEDAGWTPADTVLDVRAGTRELQDEVPPEEPIEAEGVTVVFDQSPAPEVEGYHDGPFTLAKHALGDAFECEVWVDAVLR